MEGTELIQLDRQEVAGNQQKPPNQGTHIDTEAREADRVAHHIPELFWMVSSSVT